jgi:hypothetical protein
MRERQMTAAQFELLDVDQAAAVLQWRFKKLIEAGHDVYRALLMAAKPEIEIRLASDLLSVVGERRAR